MIEIAIYGDQLRAKGNLETAFRALDAGVLDDALAEFDKARSLDPSNFAVWTGLAFFACRLLVAAPRVPRERRILELATSSVPDYLEKAARYLSASREIVPEVKIVFFYNLLGMSIFLIQPQQEELIATFLVNTLLAPGNLTEETLCERTKPFLSLVRRPQIQALSQQIVDLQNAWLRREQARLAETLKEVGNNQIATAKDFSFDLERFSLNYGFIPGFSEVAELTQLARSSHAILEDNDRIRSRMIEVDYALSRNSGLAELREEFWTDLCLDGVVAIAAWIVMMLLDYVILFSVVATLGVASDFLGSWFEWFKDWQCPLRCWN